MNTYENLFIVSLANGEDAAKETVNKFTTLIANNAEIVEVAEWGKRRLAYAINDENEGYYTVVTFKTASDFPAELDRLFNIDENVMRAMTIKLDVKAIEKNNAAKKAPVVEAVEEVAEVTEAVADAE
ncbi:MAG: 30S ribosomal protein S6 [Clostridia bacterium]|nr:30S ribosomal protein S6 [Clostridia bacterium]